LKQLQALGLTEQQLAGRTIYKGKGCRNCNNTGYYGRLGIFEMMEMNRQLREMAFRTEPTNVIREQARRSGMITLMEDGVRKILAGITSVDEVLATAQQDVALV
jgi:type II secretory ATPase GspE/PulE/Tfp pilus assembly ATPase PilB-like protein